MKDLALWAIARGREPSTYAGLAAVLLALHVSDAASWASVITTSMVGLCGVAAMAFKETGALN